MPRPRPRSDRGAGQERRSRQSHDLRHQNQAMDRRLLLAKHGPVVSYGKTSKGTNYTQDNEANRRAASEEPMVKSRREALVRAR